MSTESFFTVATLGFDERDRIVLRDLLRLSEHRSPIFRMHTSASGPLPHVLVVNADRPDVIAKWYTSRNSYQARYRCSDVLLGGQPPTAAAKYCLRRPALLADWFALLNRIVVEDHGYQAPRVTSTTDPIFAVTQDEIPAAVLAVAASLDAPAAQPPASASAVAPQASVPAPAATQETAVIMELPVSSSAEIDALLAGVSAPARTTAAKPAAPTVNAHEVKQAAAQARVTPAAERAAPVSAGKARILVVDDSLPVRIQMKTALQGLAAAIDFADTGEQAMLLLDNRKYDVIFLDVILPGKDGYEVCRYIRRHPLQKKAPVIMLTGNSRPADRVKGKMAGCDTYLIKPVRQSVLAEVVGDFIKMPGAAA